MGLLRPDGPGSLCHPDRSRVVYGDGTVVSPLYRPPSATREPDNAGGTRTYLDADGDPITRPRRRFDPDAADHHGHTGPVHGQNFVGLYARGDAAHQRIVLAVDRVPHPGAEADTAVALIKSVHTVAGAGIQAIVYDGAIRGTHIEQLMTGCGVVVINKVHSSAPRSPAGGGSPQHRATHAGTRSAPGSTTPRAAPATTTSPPSTARSARSAWTTTGPRWCCPAAAAAGEATEAGQRALPLHRRLRRALPGRGVPRLDHPAPAAPGDAGRADAVPLIAEGEPDFTRLYPIRSDAESRTPPSSARCSSTGR